MDFKRIYMCGYNVVDKLRGKILRYLEVKKFKESCRVAIYAKVHLSEEQKKQIDQLYTSNYGSKIPYTWHRHYTAFTGKFDVNYFPELLYIPEFERFMNYDQHYARVLKDKNLLPYLAQAAQICTPNVLLSCVEGLYRDAQSRMLDRAALEKQLDNLGEVFAKPSVNTSSGRGCAVLNMRNGKDTISGKSTLEVLKELGTNFVIQERVICHESIAKIYPHCVNTFRIITYRWKDEICHMPIILRIGVGGKNVDNAHAGGMFIAVDDNGALHDRAFTEFNVQYVTHPDTHFVFKGYVIPHMAQVIEAAKRMHALLPQLGCCNWDFSLNQDGKPILIEINLRGGGCWPAQMSHGKGLFGDKTAEVLRWIRTMKKLPYSGRKLYQYGRMPPHL